MVIFKNEKKNARYFVPILFNVVCLERDFKSSFFLTQQTSVRMNNSLNKSEKKKREKS